MTELDDTEISSIAEDFMEHASCVRVCTSDDMFKTSQITVTRKTGEEITGDCKRQEATKICHALNALNFVSIGCSYKETNKTELNYLHPDEVKALSSIEEGIMRVKFDGTEGIKEIPVGGHIRSSNPVWMLLMNRRCKELDPISKLEPVAPEPL